MKPTSTPLNTHAAILEAVAQRYCSPWQPAEVVWVAQPC